MPRKCIDIHQYTTEEIATALYLKMEAESIAKGTDKTKWREVVTAEKLGHRVHPSISAGHGKAGYGSDAFDPVNEVYAEYKSKAIVDGEIRNLLEKIRFPKSGKRFAPLSVSGVYNGFNSNYETASVEYAKNDHYFTVFHKELCVLIIKVDTDYVMNTLETNYRKYVANGKKGTSNLNTVTVNLGDTEIYTVAYKNEEFYASH
jgi:hypothetical protein